MIKHTLKDQVVYLSIDKIDFSYRIPLKKLGNTTDWKVGEKAPKGVVVKNVSSWALQLLTKKATEEKYIKQFKTIVQEYAPSNTINWEDTFLAINIQNYYNWLVASNETAEKKSSEEEILANIKKKYKLD